ncbi:MAG: hypothetical protein IKL79_03520 [Clostridia bacterium]|nr:hypothetical protein [Clostridia bacterium]
MKKKLCYLLLLSLLITCLSALVITAGAEENDGTWLAENPNAPTDYAYSMVVVPDTQFLTESDVNNGTEYLNSIYDWIIANKDEKKIELVMGLGDITDDDTEAEWLHAEEQIGKLNGVVPYTLVKGGSPHDRIATFNTYFGVDSYYGQNELDGIYEDGYTQNAYKLVTAGGIDYLILMLDFGPVDEVLQWAGNIISQHPERQVIVTTHCYLYKDGRLQTETDPASPRSTTATGGTLLKNNGDEIWDELVKLYPNIVMVLSGHYSSNTIIKLQSEGVCGNTVTQMLIDSQDYDNANGCETGFVAVLYFSEDGKQISVEYISTVRANEGKAAYFLASNQFSVDLFAEVEAPAPGEYDTPYGNIPDNYDIETYPFAVFVPDATSETGYKFSKATMSILTDNALGVGTTASAMNMLRPDQNSAAVSGAVILMRRNFEYNHTSTCYSNINFNVAEFTLDLGGFTFYDNHTASRGLFDWVPKAKATTNDFTFTIKNGNFVLGAQPLVTHSFSGDNQLNNTMTTVLKNVDISFKEGATATSVFGPMFTQAKYVNGSGTYKNFHNFNIAMVDCTVDYANAPDGTDLLADGSSVRSTFTTSGCEFKNRKNVLPKMNITMAGELILNVYVPVVTTEALDTVTAMTLGGIEFSVKDARVIELDSEDYYKLSLALTPDSLGTLLSLSVDVNHVYTYYGNTTASKTINSTIAVDIINYLADLAGDSDAAVAALGKDILSYVRAAYDYAEGNAEIIEKIDGIIGADYATNNKPADMTKKEITDGMASASLELGAMPAFIFYPELDGEGNPVYSLDRYQFALDGQYRLNAEIRVDESGRKYFYISTYAYAMVGTVEYLVTGTDIHGYYNLKAYYDFTVGYGDAKLTALVERLLKYAESAKAYRESR